MFPGARSSLRADHVKRPRANPGAENIQAGVVVPIDRQAARRTCMCAHGQGLRNQFTTTRAFLTGVSRIDSNQVATSLFNFVVQHRDEL